MFLGTLLADYAHFQNKNSLNIHIFYQTKGDNNNDPDNYLIELHEIIGTTNHKVKYIGLPTIWLAEIFE